MASKSTRKLLVVGSSGHARVLVDAIERGTEYEIVGYVDDTKPPASTVGSYPVLGAFSEIANVCHQNYIENLVLAIGDNWWRRRIYLDVTKSCTDLRFPAITHPSAVVSHSAQVGMGAAVLANAHVGPNSRVGQFCIVNTGSSMDHDCKLHDFASIAPGVFMGGLVEIGECSAVGVGTSISDRIAIGRHTVVGAGAVVVRNIPDLVVAYGNPALVKRSRKEGEKYFG
jgi:sugar O-acyltransferase (sialic acid O-acetyltransferase NeuD family)